VGDTATGGLPFHENRKLRYAAPDVTNQLESRRSETEEAIDSRAIGREPRGAPVYAHGAVQFGGHFFGRITSLPRRLANGERLAKNSGFARVTH
jgi:hypothetical protein